MSHQSSPHTSAGWSPRRAQILSATTGLMPFSGHLLIAVLVVPQASATTVELVSGSNSAMSGPCGRENEEIGLFLVLRVIENGCYPRRPPMSIGRAEVLPVAPRELPPHQGEVDERAVRVLVGVAGALLIPDDLTADDTTLMISFLPYA